MATIFSEGLRVYLIADAWRGILPPAEGAEQSFLPGSRRPEFLAVARWQTTQMTDRGGSEITAIPGRLRTVLNGCQLARPRRVPTEIQSAIDFREYESRTDRVRPLRSTLNLIPGKWGSRPSRVRSRENRKRHRFALEAMTKVGASRNGKLPRILPLPRVDSRLGSASDGAGLIRGIVLKP